MTRLVDGVSPAGARLIRTASRQNPAFVESAIVRDASERRIPRLGVVGDQELAGSLLAVRREGGRSELIAPEELAAEVGQW
jgi:threonyl-tRNA synthetase